MCIEFHPSPLFDYLNHYSPQDIASAIEGCHPQVTALILSQTMPEQAAKILAHFSPQDITEIFLRIQNAKPPADGVAKMIADSLRQCLETKPQSFFGQYPDEQWMANVVQHFNESTKKENLLELLEMEDRLLAKSIQEHMAAKTT